MERYIIKKPRMSDYPPNLQTAKQMITISGGNDESQDEGMFLERTLHQNQNFTHTTVPMYMPYSPAYNKQGFGNVQINSPGYMVNCLTPGQRPMVSGIDPRYLAAYADPNANYIATGQPIQRERGSMPAHSVLSGDYQNRMPLERNLAKAFTSTENAQEQTIFLEPQKPAQNNFQTMNSKRVQEPTMILEPPKSYQKEKNNTQTNWQSVNTKRVQEPTIILEPPKPYLKENNTQNNWQSVNTAPTKKAEAPDVHRSEFQNQIMSRADKLKALHRSGARVFSGPVDNVLKWHKALQDIGVYVLYEIVAKCVSIRPGEACAKNLVVRDESGPAMQIVYYEVDFLLPELKPPCTIRIIGRMMAGTSRFQAFHVRPATGDDVATQPRRAAVAAHHVAKICKEYA